LKKQFWGTTEAINIICRLRPDRPCLSSGPGNHDAENFPFGLPHKPWKWDATEQRFWYVRKLLNDAMKFGRIESVPPPREPQSAENKALFGEEMVIDIAFHLLTPKAFLLWCYKSLDDIPPFLLGRFSVAKKTTMTNAEEIGYLKNEVRRDAIKIKNLVAVLALLMDSPETYIKGAKVGIELLILEMQDLCENKGKHAVLGFDQPEERMRKRAIQNMINPIRKNIGKSS
jgi:hypothetical protein